MGCCWLPTLSWPSTTSPRRWRPTPSSMRCSTSCPWGSATNAPNHADKTPPKSFWSSPNGGRRRWPLWTSTPAAVAAAVKQRPAAAAVAAVHLVEPEVAVADLDRVRMQRGIRTILFTTTSPSQRQAMSPPAAARASIKRPSQSLNLLAKQSVVISYSILYMVAENSFKWM